MVRLRRFLCLVLGAVCFIDTVSVADAALTVTDSRGNIVTLNAPAQRIITLAPHAAELVFASGAGAQLVAVSERSDMPADVRTLPVIGNAHAMDLERIVALKPSLIVSPAYLSSAQQRALHARRIALYIADAQTPDAIADNIEALGILSGHEAVARNAAQRYRAQLANLTVNRASSSTSLTVFYQIWDTPLYTVGGGSLIDQAITRCGGRNLFSALKTPAPVVSHEAVIDAKPRIIVMGASEEQFVNWKTAWLRWPQIPAVRDQAFINIDPDLLHRPGPRFVEGIALLCHALHKRHEPLPRAPD